MRLPASQFADDPNLVFLAENTPPGRRRKPVPQEGDLDHLLSSDEEIQRIRREEAGQPEPEPAAQPEPEPLPPENQAIADQALAQIEQAKNTPPPQEQVAADVTKAVEANAGPAAIAQPKLSSELPDRGLLDKAPAALAQRDVQAPPQAPPPPPAPAAPPPATEPSPAAQIMSGTATGPAPEAPPAPPEPPKSAPGPAPASGPKSPELPYGAIEAPTLDLTHRPWVKNADGSTSTVRSMGVNLDGKEILIPTVSKDGRIMSDDEAIAEYQKTGEHLGVYPSVEASNRAGELIHQDQMRHPPINTLAATPPPAASPEPAQPAAATPPPEAASPPLAAATPPPEAVPQAAEQGAAAEQAPPDFKSQTLATAPAGQSKLVTKSPQWYDFDKPPEYTGNEAAILSLVAGIIQAGIAPNKKVALAMLAGGAFDAATAKLGAPMKDYQNRLDAAGKQAQMTATLKASQGGRDQDTLAREKFEYQKKQDQDKAHYEAQTKIRGTPESDEMADSYIAGGYYPPEAKETLSGWQMKMGRVGAGQQAAQGRQFANQDDQREKHYLQWLSQQNLLDTENNRRFFRDQQAKIEGEERGRVADVEKMEIPGLKYTGRRALPPEVYSQAIEIKGAMDTIEKNGRELVALQKKVSDPLSQRTGGWLQLFPNGEDQKAVLARMQTLQQQSAAAQRVVWKQGVPQEYELASNERTNPNAKDPWSFFRGAYDWKALADGARETGSRQLRDRKYVVDDGSGRAVTVNDEPDKDPSDYYIGAFLVGKGKHRRELTQKDYDALKAQGYAMVPTGE